MIVDHRCGKCAMQGGAECFFFLLAEGQSVQCSVKRYSGRGKERVKDGGGVRPQGLTETL